MINTNIIRSLYKPLKANKPAGTEIKSDIILWTPTHGHTRVG